MLSSSDGKNHRNDDSVDVEQQRNQDEISTAAALLSISGPCRSLGDLYLTCVATAGLGMCRHLRANFEQCAKGTTEGSKEYLTTLGSQMCPQISGKGENKNNGRQLCAARIINQQLMMQLSASASPSKQEKQR